MNRKGFTLIELMIVIAIIAIIASIALPGLLRSRMSANEASAIGGVRTIYSAEIQFQIGKTKMVGSVSQYGTLVELGSVNPPLLDNELGGSLNPEKDGYLYSIAIGADPNLPSFEITASAQDPKKGSRNFYVNEDGVIRWSPQANGDATSTDTPL